MAVHFVIELPRSSGLLPAVSEFIPYANQGFPRFELVGIVIKLELERMFLVMNGLRGTGSHCQGLRREAFPSFPAGGFAGLSVKPAGFAYSRAKSVRGGGKSFKTPGTALAHETEARRSTNHGPLVKSKVRSNTTVFQEAVLIRRPCDELYQFVRDFSNAATFMKQIRSVTEIHPGHIHWVAKTKDGKLIEWNSFLTEELDGRRVVWKTWSKAKLPHTMAIEMHPKGMEASEVVMKLKMDLTLPENQRLARKFFGKEISHQIQEDLQRLKWLMDSGIVSARSSHG